MAKKRALEPESEVLLRKEHDRASKAKKRALEPESEALLRKEHDRASKAKKRALEPESEALLRKQSIHGHNLINTGEVCTSVLFIMVVVTHTCKQVMYDHKIYPVTTNCK